MATATSLSSSGLARIQRQIQQYRATRGIDPPQSYIESLYSAAMEAELETADTAQARQQALDIQSKSLEQSSRQFNESLALQRQQLKAQGRTDAISGVGTLALGGAMLYPQIKGVGAALGIGGKEAAITGAGAATTATGIEAAIGTTGAAGQTAALSQLSATGAAYAGGAPGTATAAAATDAGVSGAATSAGAATGAGEAAGLTWSGAAGSGVAGFGAGMLASQIGGGKSTTTKATKGAVGGAAAGAVIGSIIPGGGTVIGGIIGAITGAIGGGSSK